MERNAVQCPLQIIKISHQNGSTRVCSLKEFTAHPSNLSLTVVIACL